MLSRSDGTSPASAGGNHAAVLQECCGALVSSTGMTPRDEDEVRTTPPLKFGVTAILADHHGSAAAMAKDRERIFGGARTAAAASLLAAAAATGKSDLACRTCDTVFVCDVFIS